MNYEVICITSTSRNCFFFCTIHTSIFLYKFFLLSYAGLLDISSTLACVWKKALITFYTRSNTYVKKVTNNSPIYTNKWIQSSILGSCETYEQEKSVCYYHDCLKGTIPKPDYRLVDDKVYFDCSMKYMYPDDDLRKDNVISDEATKTELTWSQLANEGAEEIKETGRDRKSKAMVINHKIYF